MPKKWNDIQGAVTNALYALNDAPPRKPKSRPYYTLLSLEPRAANWAIEFGDYDRDCVESERDDMKESATLVAGTKFKIIKTTDAQAAIDAAVSKLNAARTCEPLNEHFNATFRKADKS